MAAKDSFPFHFFRNKLSIIEGVIVDVLAGNTLTEQELLDGKEAVDAVMAKLLELQGSVKSPS